MIATSAAEWLARLIRVPSVTPAQAGPRAGAPGEGALARAVAGWFRELGADEVITEDVQPGRPNVYAIWRGRGERWRGLDVHLDTVGVEQMRGDPFGGELRGGRIYGRGACDTKASLAVVLALIAELRASGGALDGNLLIAATADEEDGASGAPAFAAWARRRGLTLDELIVAEPTGCAPVYGHKGVARVELTVAGLAAHSARPEQGRNAISAAARVVLAMDAEHARLQDAPPAPLGRATLGVTLIGGGRGINVIPDECRISLDRRVLVGEHPDALCAELAEIARAASPLPVSARTILALGAFWQNPADPLVRRLAAWSGRAPEMAGYGTNAFAYAETARACVVLGPGDIAQAHGDEEWVMVEELERLAMIYRRWWEAR
jgi:acetylornithine deacetylase/succinyl-diaminopimelate desuccinylase-like protein